MQQLLAKKEKEESNHIKSLIDVMPNYGIKDKSFRLFANLDTDKILQSQIDQYKLEEFKAQKK